MLENYITSLKIEVLSFAHHGRAGLGMFRGQNGLCQAETMIQMVDTAIVPACAKDTMDTIVGSWMSSP